MSDTDTTKKKITDGKSVSIKEGRKTRNFDKVKRIITPSPGGDSITWVPEDETMDVDDGVILNVTHNGEYKPDEGKFFSSVNASVVPTLVDKTFTENGTYKVTEKDVDEEGHKADGFGTVRVKVKGSGGFGDLNFFKKGTITRNCKGLFNLEDYAHSIEKYSGGTS